MSQGVEELENWLADTIRQGIAGLEQQPDFWKDISARMVDAKLGSIGRRLKLLRLQIGNRDNWYEYVSQELGNLYLLARAFRKIDALPPLLQLDILTLAGVNQKTATILQNGPIIQDNWMCLATSEKEEDNLRSRRTWIYGWKYNRFGLILDFAWGRTDFKERYRAGEVFEGKLAFYPSTIPLRVVVQEKTTLTNRPIKKIIGFSSLSDFLDNYSTAIAANPWLIEYPCSIENVTPLYQNNELSLLDNQQCILPISPIFSKKMELLAISGGYPINVFGEWTGHFLMPRSVSVEDRFITF